MFIKKNLQTLAKASKGDTPDNWNASVGRFIYQLCLI